MAPLSRRQFLRIAAGTVATAGLAGRVVRAAPAAARPRRRGIERIPTFCDMCFWKCGAIATVRDGKLWKIEGNPRDPLSRGRLCPRGTAGVGAHVDPDRLRAPLVRARSRGDEVWRETTWDEALDLVARKLRRLKADHGPEALALFSHGIGATPFHRLAKAYGTPNLAAPGHAQCRGAREVGFSLTFGDDVGSPERTDIENAQCLVLIGSHLGENMHNSQVQEFADAVGKGASVIVADPRFSVAASKAKFYLPIRPGADLALLLAWMHVIVEEGLHDRAYVERHGFGFDAFAASLRPWTPEWAYPETGIDPETIRTTAREMARYRPATLVHPGRHVAWYGDDTQRSRAIALLNALLGSWGRKGGFTMPSSMDLPEIPCPAYPKPARPIADGRGRRYPFATEGITTGLRDATLTGEPYPIRGWMVYATNPLYSLPDQEATIRAIRGLDFLVVVDTLPSEIAGWADVVLPEAVYLERYDELNPELYKRPFLALRQPVVDPPADQKPGWWIAKELAGRLGLGAYFPWKDAEDYLGRRLAAGGYDFAQLKRDGIVLGRRPPIYFEEGAPAEFDTPSGKIEFYSPQLAKAGFDPVPRYTRPPEGPPGSFRLLTGRAPVHTFSRTQTNPLLFDQMSENEVWVNASAALRMGLKSGDRVRLRNQDGVLGNSVRVKATERIRPDCVYLVHGFGHTAKGLRTALGRGASDSRLMTRYAIDPLMGGSGMNLNFVTLETEA